MAQYSPFCPKEVKAKVAIVELLLFLFWMLILPMFIAHWFVFAKYLSTDFSLQGTGMVILLFLMAYIIHPLSFAFLGGVLSLAMLWYLHVNALWGAAFLAHRFFVLFQVNKAEIFAYLQEYIFQKPVNVLFLIWFLVSLALVVRNYCIARQIRQYLSFHLRHRIALALMLFSVLYLFSFQERAASYPGILTLRGLIEAVMEAQKFYARRKIVHTRPPVGPQPCNPKLDTLVIVIGESANRDVMHVYGFDLPTTPFLDRLHEQGALVLRAIAPGLPTHLALALELTEATPRNFYNFYQTPSVVSWLKSCGYRVYWFSNQEQSLFTAVAYEVAKEGDAVRTTQYKSFNPKSYDESLLPFLKDFPPSPDGKQVYIFHLMGSHAPYAFRYPPGTGIFLHPRTDYEDYLNTIAYTDKVLQRIWRYFEERLQGPWAFVYFSDHADYVTPQRMGYGREQAHQDEFRIPFIIWVSSSELGQPIWDSLPDQGLINLESFPQALYSLVLQRPFALSTSPWVLHLSPQRYFNYYSLPAANRPETVEMSPIVEQVPIP